ncbi:MAG: carbohydrate kinase [Prevotella sp.]
MRKVIGMGETVLDIVFRDRQPDRSVPGGSTLNAIVSLERSGVPTVFMTETGHDRVGREIKAFLDDCGVDTGYIRQWSGMKTPVSLAFLDDDNNAEYSFYRSGEAPHEPTVLPLINRDDIVIVGSFYAVNAATRQQVKALLEQARQSEAIVIYDVNYRPAHKADLPSVMSNIIENMKYADIVKGSNEDFALIFGTEDPREVYDKHVAQQCPRMIMTCGERAVTVIDYNSIHSFTPQPVKTVSTIGAGDNFNAGTAYALVRYNITRDRLGERLTDNETEAIVRAAMAFASDCCKQTGNYISEDFGRRMAEMIKQE